MIASLLGILGGFILLMLGLILGIHSEHTTVGVLIRQSTKLIEIVNANQDQVNKLKRQSDRLKEVA